MTLAEVLILIAIVDGAAAVTRLRTVLWIIVIAFAVFTLPIRRWLRPHAVSIARRPGLTFTKPWPFVFASSLSCGVALVSQISLWFDQRVWSSAGPWGQFATILLPFVGLYLLASAAWSCRTPAGLTVTSEGLTGVREGPHFRLAWHELRSVSVAEGFRGDSLVLEAEGGRIVIRAPALGGDMGAISALVNYYRDHPEEPPRLTDGIEAVGHLAREVVARRFLPTRTSFPGSVKWLPGR